MNTSIVSMIHREEKLTRNDISYLMYDIQRNEDIETLDYIQETILNRFGKDFINSSKNKIEFILKILIDNDEEELYNFYNMTSLYYLKTNKDIVPFNLIFLTYINLAWKVIN